MGRRLLGAIPTLLGISVVTFLLAKAMPGDPFLGIMHPNATLADVERLRGLAGLKAPLWTQYWQWLTHVIRGDFGLSIAHNAPVKQLISERLPVTVSITVSALAIGLALGIPGGVIAAARYDTVSDRLLSVLAVISISLPPLLIGLILLKHFAITLQWFPSSNVITPGQTGKFPFNYIDAAHHLVLPSVTLGIGVTGIILRHVRAGMLEVLDHDYVRTARAKGLPERIVFYRHALRNALLPVVTVVALALPGLIGGAVITEQVFSIPGMGRLTYTAVLRRDYPLIMGVTTVFAVVTVAANLLADLLYTWLDPRVRYD